jgi:hypothetical protein
VPSHSTITKIIKPCSGRKPKLDEAGIEAGLELLKTRPLKDVAHILHVSESTVRRRVMNAVPRANF